MIKKYKPFSPIVLPERVWPNQTITKAPIWCSVDLRDGNQALIEPMGLEKKRYFFDLLVKMGYKEIEVGFPSASQTDYDFIRHLIETKRIPQDVTIQVLTQAREDLIDRTFESISGAKRVIVHLYNSTSEVQRRLVFQLSKPEIIEIARQGVEWIKARVERCESEIVFQYSPESFTGTEVDFAVEICQVVMETWQPSREKPMILNLPATVEMSTPNIYADQIEYFHRRCPNRDRFILSVHPHNDRGTAIAATELALMAGAQRVEGTLFGNGERTGNVDLVTLALNLYTQGIDPEIKIGDINDLVKVYEYCNQLKVSERHPYAGSLVFTAFSGSHQDAIKKGFQARARQQSPLWEVPYLPIDPRDIGKTYEAVVRINSQSGKSGISYVMKRDYGIELPRGLQIEFGKTIQRVSDKSGKEVDSLQLWEIFATEYLANSVAFKLLDWGDVQLHRSDGRTMISFQIESWGTSKWIESAGNGPIDAFMNGLATLDLPPTHLIDYQEHAIKEGIRANGVGADAQAIAFIELADQTKTTSTFGVGIHENIVIASLKGIISALNRLSARGALDRRSTRHTSELAR